MLAALVASLTAGAVAAGTDVRTQGAVVTEHPDRGDRIVVDATHVRRAVLISDSALASIRWLGKLDRLTNTRWETYLESCRRLVYLSCRGRDGYAPLTAAYEIRELVRRQGTAHPDDVIVIAGGYNDWETQFRAHFAKVVTKRATPASDASSG